MSHNIVTETLAKLYQKHGAPDKAKEIYSILLEQNPDRNDYQTIIEDLDKQPVKKETSLDYRQTLNEGFANDQNGMPLNEAINAFDEDQQSSSVKKEYDPELMDQIMLMTDYDDALEDMESINHPIRMPSPVPDSSNQTEPLTNTVHQWLDLILIKRKMNQLKKLKQHIQ